MHFVGVVLRNYLFVTECLVGCDSVFGIDTCKGLEGYPSGAIIFHTLPYWPWDQPSLLYSGYWVIPRGKAAGL